MVTLEKPNRVALFLPDLDGGGAERVMVNLAQGLCDAGVATDMVLVNATGPYLTELHGAVRLVNLESKGAFLSLPGLLRYLRDARPDSLLATANHCNVVAAVAGRLSRVPTRVVLRQSNTLTGMPTSGAKHQILLRLARHVRVSR